MYRESGAAVEAAGIARLIQVDPAAFKVFSEDDGSETARRNARKTFAPAVLFPKDKPQMHILADFYDTASRLSHTSGLTFVRHLAQPSGGTARFSYQDIAVNNVPRELPMPLLTLCQTHIMPASRLASNPSGRRGQWSLDGWFAFLKFTETRPVRQP
jgi:hypothetical protein